MVPQQHAGSISNSSGMAAGMWQPMIGMASCSPQQLHWQQQQQWHQQQLLPHQQPQQRHQQQLVPQQQTYQPQQQPRQQLLPQQQAHQAQQQPQQPERPQQPQQGPPEQQVPWPWRQQPVAEVGQGTASPLSPPPNPKSPTPEAERERRAASQAAELARLDAIEEAVKRRRLDIARGL